MNRHYSTYNKKILRYRISDYIIVMLALLLISYVICPVNAFAELKALGKTELKNVTGRQGMTDFSVSNDVTRLFVDIHIETAGTIDSFKAGYRDNGFGMGWDNDATAIKIGSETEAVTVDGLVFMADFDNVSSSNRTLQRLVIGTNRVQGTISADMNSYSGVYNDALTGGSGNPVFCDRTNLGSTTFNFDSNISETENMGFFMVFTLEGTHPGIQMVSGYDENTMNSAFTAGEWWDAP